MPEDIKRMRYYNGLFLQQEEFQLEQDYNVRMRRIHNARLHGKGIVWGLDVTVGTVADSVIVEQGMALDYYHEAGDAEYQSHEIVVVQDTPVDLSQYAGDDEVWLWIRYDESPAGDDPDRGDQPFNTIEGFQIEHSLTRPVDEDLNIVLARIVVNSDDTIDANSISYDDPTTGFSVRVGSGFAGPRVETDMLTLRAPTTAAPWAYMTGNEFDPGGPNRAVGINVVSERTRFTGPVDVEGNVDVQNDLVVQQNAVITGTTTASGDVGLQQNLSIAGTIDSANPSGALEINDALNVAQGATIQQDLTVAGSLRSANPSDAVELDDDLHISGALQVGTSSAISEISTDGTLADNSDEAVPTEQAVRTFVESKISEFVNAELVGSVVAFAMDTVPSGWLECNGTDVDRTTYAALFARIGESYGAGDGSTTFTLPDLRGEFVRGWDNGRGVDTGRAMASAQLDAFQGHLHSARFQNASAPFQQGTGFGGADWTFSPNASIPTGRPVDDGLSGPPRDDSETRPRNVAMVYCIKY